MNIAERKAVYSGDAPTNAVPKPTRSAVKPTSKVLMRKSFDPIFRIVLSLKLLNFTGRP
jgi:hypothetical protein